MKTKFESTDPISVWLHEHGITTFRLDDFWLDIYFESKDDATLFILGCPDVSRILIKIYYRNHSGEPYTVIDLL